MLEAAQRMTAWPDHVLQVLPFCPPCPLHFEFLSPPHQNVTPVGPVPPPGQPEASYPLTRA